MAGQISVYIQCSFVHRNDVWSAHTIWINLGLGFTQPWVTSVRVAHRINDPFHPLHWHTHSIHLRIYNQENYHKNKKKLYSELQDCWREIQQSEIIKKEGGGTSEALAMDSL